jgi:hypothetical protein
VGRPEPPAIFTVVVEVEVMQVSWVLAPTVKANHPPFGASGISEVVAEAPSLQKAMLVVPTLEATTTAPVGRVPVTPPVVTLIGVPVDWIVGKPVVEEEKLPVTFSWPLTSVWM